jgi:hypothetical protein
MPTYRASQSGYGPPPRSGACTGEGHADCGHLYGIGRPEDARPEVLLCRCGCHSECPLADHFLLVSREVWQAECTCPGTGRAADRLDEAEREEPPHFADFERQLRARLADAERESQQRRAAMRGAFEAARAAGTGKSRAEIREIYVAELRARGLAIPSDLVLDAYADAIARNREKLSVIHSVRALVGLGRDFRKVWSRSGQL